MISKEVNVKSKEQENVVKNRELIEVVESGGMTKIQCWSM